MKCPKCGFEQEERKECLRCGVIFSKFLALYPRGSRAAEAAETRTRVEEEPAWQDTPPDYSSQIQSITRKLNEIEIDRGERFRIQAEMRIIEQKLTDTIAELSGRIQSLEARLQERGEDAPAVEAAPPADLRGEIQASLDSLDLPSLVSRLELVEAAVEKPAERSDPGVLNNLFQIEERLRGLESNRPAAAEGEATENLLDAAELPEHLEEFVQDLGRIQGSIEELEQRGVEFDRLKQTHGDILRNVDAMRSDLEALRHGEGETAATEKTARLAGEVAALRGDLQTLAEAVLEQRRAHPERDNLVALEERLERFGGEIEAMRGTGSTEGAEAPGRLEELSSELGRLRGALEGVTLRYSEIGELKKNHLQLSSSLESIHRDLAAVKEGVAKGYLQRVEDVEKEVGALRAEVRQVITKLETKASRRSGGS